MHTASKIQAVKDEWDSLPDRRKALDEALTLNRKLWVFLMGGVLEEGNPLPNEIKSNIVNLAHFIFNHTIALTFEPKREGLDILIAINSNVAAGLRASLQASQGQAAPSASTGTAERASTDKAA